MKLDPVALLETKLFLGHARYGLVYFDGVDVKLVRDFKMSHFINAAWSKYEI